MRFFRSAFQGEAFVTCSVAIARKKSRRPCSMSLFLCVASIKVTEGDSNETHLAATQSALHFAAIYVLLSKRSLPISSPHNRPVPGADDS